MLSAAKASGCVTFIGCSDAFAVQPVLGGTTDTLGNFSITNVPVGRYDLKITYVGYKEAFMREVTFISAKQTVLSVSINANATILLFLSRVFT